MLRCRTTVRSNPRAVAQSGACPGICGYRMWFLFALQYFIFLGLNIWNEIANRSDSGTVQVVLSVQKEMTASILNMAASTYLILEGVMLAQWLKDRDKRKQREAFDEGKDEGRDEGSDETHQIWQAWYGRMQAAQREGLPFDEPPPGQENERAEG